ncbi:cytochrome P450 family protein [Streptomyces mangrovisoli]|uniref:Cytochrome n=1 Tax=Streptomyces mangrovisoli TaxID=1428628 RepID=A0A1J4P014_9ACTN|nr:cytochrome P450 [Streptomyces mangrovisoli]OIJ68073.1 cytochrome [Streptomyces mangrovisoli]
MARQAQRCPYAIDPFGRDIHAEAARLRTEGPVGRVTLPGGVEAWFVSGHEEVRRLLTDERVSKDAYRHWPQWISGEVDESWPLSMWVSVRNMITSYGEDHRRLRRLVTKAFTARRIAQLRPRIEEITAGLLDGLEAEARRAGGAVEFRTAFAQRLPTAVLAELFGVPREFHARLQKIITLFFDTTATAEVAHANQIDVYTTIAELVALKRDSGGDDLTCALIAVRDEGDGSRLTERELIDSLILMYTAAFETTVNLLDNAVSLLLTHPDQLELIRGGKAQWADAVEETLRVEAPGANGIFRYAVEDIPIGGTVIGKGDPMVISFVSAGRDPQTHGADADRFDVLRPTRRDHLSFGHGPHYCLGAPLARMEAEIALEGLFARFPDLSLAVPAGLLRPLESFISNGHRELPLHLGGQPLPTTA